MMAFKAGSKVIEPFQLVQSGYDGGVEKIAKPGEKVRCVGQRDPDDKRFTLGRVYLTVEWFGKARVMGDDPGKTRVMKKRKMVEVDEPQIPHRGWGWNWETVQ